MHDGFWAALGQTAPGDAASLGTRFAWFCAAISEESPEGVPPGGVAQVLLMAMAAGLGLPLARSKGAAVGGLLSAALSARAAAAAMTVAGVERADEAAVLAAIKAVWRGSATMQERKSGKPRVSGAAGESAGAEGGDDDAPDRAGGGGKPASGLRRRGVPNRGAEDSDEGDVARKASKPVSAGKSTGAGERRGDRGRGTSHKAAALPSDEEEARSEVDVPDSHASPHGTRGRKRSGTGGASAPAPKVHPLFIPPDELYDEDGKRRCRFHAAEPGSCKRNVCTFSHKPAAPRAAPTTTA